MKICELKIDRKFFGLLKEGKKIYEVRKMNKYYIEDNDVIRYLDLETKEVLGYFKVNFTVLSCPKRLLLSGLFIDKMTREFIEENYMNEEDIILFNVSELEEIKCITK